MKGVGRFLKMDPEELRQVFLNKFRRLEPLRDSYVRRIRGFDPLKNEALRMTWERFQIDLRIRMNDRGIAWYINAIGFVDNLESALKGAVRGFLRRSPNYLKGALYGLREQFGEEFADARRVLYPIIDELEEIVAGPQFDLELGIAQYEKFFATCDRIRQSFAQRRAQATLALVKGGAPRVHVQDRKADKRERDRQARRKMRGPHVEIPLNRGRGNKKKA